MVNRIISQLMRFIDRLDRTEYLVLAVIAISIGFFCLKGFGSRTNY
jgi:hypothetical protein